MSEAITGMATTKKNVGKAKRKAKLEKFTEIQGEKQEDFIRYVTTEAAEKPFDIRIGYEYADETIKGLRYMDTDSLIFEVPKKYKERFERNIRVKSGGLVIIDG
jgi:hypothetical protein